MSLTDEEIEEKGKTWNITGLILLRMAMKFNETQVDLFTDNVL